MAMRPAGCSRHPIGSASGLPGLSRPRSPLRPGTSRLAMARGLPPTIPAGTEGPKRQAQSNAGRCGSNARSAVRHRGESGPRPTAEMPDGLRLVCPKKPPQQPSSKGTERWGGRRFRAAKRVRRRRRRSRQRPRRRPCSRRGRAGPRGRSPAERGSASLAGASKAGGGLLSDAEDGEPVRERPAGSERASAAQPRPAERVKQDDV